MGATLSALGKNKNERRKLCKKCKNIVSVFRSRRPQTENFDIMHLAPLTDLSPGCPLCQSIRQLVEPEAKESGTVQAPPEASLQATRSEPVKRYAVYLEHKHPWKVFGVEYAGFIRGYIGLLTQDNCTSVIRQSHELAEPSCSPGVPFEPLKSLTCSSDQQVSISLVRKWLLECEEKHGGACNNRESWYFSQTGSVLADQLKETLLIDVLDKCLVSASLSRRYIALSYVWGKANVFQTTKANRNDLSRQGALCIGQAQLPQTIRDAMELVEALGERYLWVDALCIVQDDASQKHELISRMHEIYDAALVTIVALSGQDADSGLPGLRARSRQAQRSIDIAGLQLITFPPPLEEEIKASYWESRAWTLQERILSRRLIYFSASQIYFQCQECVNSEVTASTLRKDPFQSMSTRGGESSLSPELLDLFPLTNQWVRCRNIGETRPLFFPVYSLVVQQYTMRNLSYQADILNAFSGIMMNFQNCYGGKYFSGLPEAFFDLALLWVSGKGQRREPAFPTWSWTSWVGRVSYILGRPVFSQREVDWYYPLASVEKFFLESEDGRRAEEVANRRWVRSWEVQFQVARTGKGRAIPGWDVGQRFSQGKILLTFRAWVKLALEFVIGETVIYVGDTSSVAHPIIDPQGKYCGMFFSGDEEPIPALKDGIFAFVLISVNQRYEPLLREPSGRIIQAYDVNCFSQDEGMANALLIEQSGVAGKRVAVAQIHHRCWIENNPQLMTVKLE